MNRITNAALAFFGFAGAVFFLSATWVIWRAPNLLLHADGTLTRSEALISKTYATMGNLDKASKAWSDSAAEQADQVKTLVKQASAAMDSAAGAIADIRLTLSTAREQMEQVGPLLDSATKATDAIPVTLDHVNQALDATKPPLAAATETIQSANKLISDPNIKAFTYHAAGMSNSGEEILANIRMVSDKAREDYLKPVPWWQWPLKRSGQVIDIGAAVARHAP